MKPLRVVVYGKAAYLRAYRQRFSFRTVGFFDGRIHVASAAHPGGELRSLRLTQPLKLGASRCLLQKPGDASELLQEVASQIDRASSAHAAAQEHGE